MGAGIVLSQVLTLFLIIGIGFAARKRNIINTEMNKKLSELLLKITLPLLIISSFQFDYSSEILRNGGIIFICAVLIHVFSIILGGFLYKMYPARTRTILKSITVFSNCGFMGFPVLDSLYGKTGVLYGSIFVAVFNLLLWTYGVILFNGRTKDGKSIWKTLLNPGVAAVIIGITLFLFSVKLPQPVFRAFDFLGSMTTPLSMLIIGALLTEVDFKSAFTDFSVYYGSAVRLVILPMITLLLMRLAGVNGISLGVCTVLTAMPGAANTAIFAEIYDGDAPYASRCVGISTALSIITIPLIVLLLQVI